MRPLPQGLPLQTWNPKHDALNIYPLWPAAISRCSRSEDGSGLPSLWEISAIWSRAALEECCSCRYITAREAAKRPSGTGEAVWTWAVWAGKEGSGSRSHQGSAKWWWVMSAVWGGEGIMVDWEYWGSVLHTILIPSYQTQAKRCLLFSWRDLHITHVLTRRIKQCWDAWRKVYLSFSKGRRWFTLYL